MSLRMQSLATLMVVMWAPLVLVQAADTPAAVDLQPPTRWSEFRSLIQGGAPVLADAKSVPQPVTPELYIRWLQRQALLPEQDLPRRLPRGLGRDASTAYSRLRSLRAALEPTLKQVGAIKPLAGSAEQGADREFMVGENILVAPVVYEDALARRVKFPAGNWQNLFEPVMYEGPGEYVVPSTLIAPAIYLREGATIKARVPADEKELVGDPDAAVSDFSFAPERAVIKNLTVPRYADAIAGTTEITFQRGAGTTGGFNVLYAELPGNTRGRLIPQAVDGAYRFNLSAVRPEPGTPQVFRLNHVENGERTIVHDGQVRWMMPMRLSLEQPEDWVLNQGTRTVFTRVWNRHDTRLPVLIRATPPSGIKVKPEVQDGWLDPNQRLMWKWQVNAEPQGASSYPVRFVLSTKAVYQGEAFAIFSKPLHWVVAGPFAGGDEQAYYLDFGPSWRPEPTAVFMDGEHRRRWEVVPEAHVLKHNGIDFAELLGEHENAAAYAMTKVRSYIEQPAVLKMGSSDTLAAWVNGHKVFERETDRTAAMDQETDRVLLKEGVNVIVAKVAHASGDWRLLLRLTGRKEQFLSGVTDGFEDLALYGPQRPATETLVAPPAPVVWHVSEPIKNPEQNNVEHLGPLDRPVDFSGDWPPKADGVTWRTEPLNVVPGGVVDLGKTFGEQEHVYAYLATTLTVKDATRVRMLVQSADGISLWLNGKRIHYRNRWRDLDHLPELIRGVLEPGENHLLVKLGTRGGDWRMRLKVLNISSVPQRPLGTDLADSTDQ